MNQDISVSRDERDRLIDEISIEVRAEQTAVDIFDDVVADKMRINRTDMRCLDILQRAEAMTAGDLARESGLTTGAVTAVLDRLERAGYARRARDTADRRKVLIEVVPEAFAGMGAYYGPLAEWTNAELAQYDDERLLFLRDFLRRGREFLEAHTDRVRRGELGSPPRSK
jgi:DNA-binding MarR family transcriptional regulator